MSNYYEIFMTTGLVTPVDEKLLELSKNINMFRSRCADIGDDIGGHHVWARLAVAVAVS